MLKNKRVITLADELYNNITYFFEYLLFHLLTAIYWYISSKLLLTKVLRATFGPLAGHSVCLIYNWRLGYWKITLPVTYNTNNHRWLSDFCWCLIKQLTFIITELITPWKIRNSWTFTNDLLMAHQQEEYTITILWRIILILALKNW